jgi:hypothetical protein
MAVALVIGRSRYAALSASRRRGSARTFGLARNSPWTGLGFWLLLAWTPDIVLAIDPRYRSCSAAPVSLGKLVSAHLALAARCNATGERRVGAGNRGDHRARLTLFLLSLDLSER